MDDGGYPPYRASGMGRAEPMRSRARIGGRFYDDPSADGRVYSDGQGPVYDYEEGDKNGQGQYADTDGYGNSDENQQPNDQQVEEDIPSSTLQPSTVTSWFCLSLCFLS